MSLHTKRLWVGCVALLASAILVTSSLAGPGKKNRVTLNPQGEPKGIKRLDEECYKVWHDNDGWHLHAVTDQKEHRFTGSIEVDSGTLERVRSELFKEGKLDPSFRKGPKEDRIDFDFKSYKEHRRIAFHTSKGAREVQFKLMIDGKEVPDLIFVGKNGDHPADGTFSLPAHPNQ